MWASPTLSGEWTGDRDVTEGVPEAPFPGNCGGVCVWLRLHSTLGAAVLTTSPPVRAQTASPSSLPHAATYEGAQGFPETLLSPRHQLPPAQHLPAAGGVNNEAVADSAQGAILKVSPCGQTVYRE